MALFRRQPRTNDPATGPAPAPGPEGFPPGPPPSFPAPPGAPAQQAPPPAPPAGTGGMPTGEEMRQILINAPVDVVTTDLRLMLVRRGTPTGPSDLVWPIGRDLLALACIKWPENGAAVPVDTGIAQAWNMTPDDVWLTAAANLRGEQFTTQRFDTAGGGAITAVMGQGWPGSSQVFRLGEALPDNPPGGTFVVLPADNVLLALSVNGRDAVNSVPFLLSTARELARDQQPLSPGLFWWHEGVLEEMDVQHHGNDARVNGSPRFSQALNAM